MPTSPSGRSPTMPDLAQIALTTMPMIATGAVAFFAKKFVNGVDKLEDGQAEMRRSPEAIRVELVGLDGTNGLRGDVRELRRDHDELKEYVDRNTPEAHKRYRG